MQFSLKKSRLETILVEIENLRVAVLGDFCLDVYWEMNSNENQQSRHSGCEVMMINQERVCLGAAGNIVMNLKKLGIKYLDVYGVLGYDGHGEHMLRLMMNENVGAGTMCLQKNWHTHAFCKRYEESVEKQLLQFGSKNVLEQETADRLLGNLEKKILEYDVIVINQQLMTGIHNSYFRKKLRRIISDHQGIYFVTDTGDFLYDYKNTIRMIREDRLHWYCERYLTEEEKKEKAVEKEIHLLLEEYCNPFVVFGDQMKTNLVYDRTSHYFPFYMPEAPVFTLGKEDAFLAAFSATLGVSGNMNEATEVGSLAAAVVLKKLKETGQATPREILKEYDRFAELGRQEESE